MSAGRMPEGRWLEVMEAQHWCCNRCGRLATEVHHRLYRSRGGTHDRINLVGLCQTCHMDVHAGSLAPWVVPGSIVRGRYRGPDESFRAFYNRKEAAA